jgi:hypothetical protein
MTLLLDHAQDLRTKEWPFEMRLCKEERLASVLPAAAARHFFGRAMIARETRNVLMSPSLAVVQEDGSLRLAALAN